MMIVAPRLAASAPKRVATSRTATARSIGARLILEAPAPYSRHVEELVSEHGHPLGVPLHLADSIGAPAEVRRLALEPEDERLRVEAQRGERSP